MNKIDKGLPVPLYLQLTLLSKWCKANGWSDLQIVDLQFYATSPGGFIPVPLPEEAFIELDNYRQVFDSLWLIRFQERASRRHLDKALIFNVAGVALLCLKDVMKNSNIPVDVPSIIYQLMNSLIAILIVFTLIEFYSSVSIYYEYCQRKTKLSRTPGFVDLLARLEISHARNIY